MAETVPDASVAPTSVPLPEIVVKPASGPALPSFDAMPDESRVALPSFDAMPDQSKPPPPSMLQSALAPITNIPATYSQMVNQAWGQMGRGVGQIASGEPWEVVKGIGNLAMGAAGYVGAPISAPLHSIVGAPVAEASGSPLLGQAAEIGAGFALPVPHLPAAAPLPAADEFGVTLSAGERANNLAMRQAEQAAIRGRPADENSHLQAWVDQRQAQLGAAKEGISRTLDPFGQEVAETPQQAGQLVSQAMQTTAASRKAGVNAAYDEARSYPGEIHAGAFEGIGQRIKGDLSLRPAPVIVDSKLTPFASRMIDDLDQRVSQLRIENRADPFGAPNPENITGVNLAGVDQMRKRLSSMRRDAFATGNAADGRAAQAVLDAFDARIDDAINSGLFNGDPRAVAAWNDARAAYADYRGTFTATKNDPVGRVVEKIIGANGGGKLPAGPAIPNDVADYLYGAQGTNPSSLNVGVANRVRDVLGERSPEWSGVKQGLFRRLVEPAPGVTEWGSGQVANRLNTFLNGDGKELAQAVYSPQERQMLQNYANLMRRITMPPGSYFPSAPGFVKVAQTVANRIAAVAGAMVGRAMIPEMPLVGELGGLTVGSQAERAMVRVAQNRVAKQLPLVAQQWQRWSKAQSAATAAPANALLQRAAVTATANLQGTLTPLLGKLDEIAGQGPATANAAPTTVSVPSYAAPQQQNVPGAPPQ